MAIADVHFAIGKTHAVCQDYGIADDPGQSGLSGSRAVAVVCDGCSSSPDTDWGARFLARAAVGTFDPFDPLTVIQRADSYRKAMELSPQCLDATMLRIKENPSGDAEVIVHGDGVVVARKRDGTRLCRTISYSLNAPAYLSYLLDPNRLATYRKSGGGFMTRLDSDGSVYMRCPPERVNNPEEVVPDFPAFQQTFSRAEYDVVLVMSDGAESFQRREGTRIVPVPLNDVLDQVLDLKVLTHGFLRRRMGKFLGKFCQENGWQHYDDFAVAGLVLDPPEGSL